jgi:hypothetical protein
MRQIRSKAAVEFELLHGSEHLTENQISYGPYIPYPINMEAHQKAHENIIEYLRADKPDIVIDVSSDCAIIGVLARDLYKKYYCINHSFYSCQNATYNLRANQVAGKRSISVRPRAVNGSCLV